MFFVTNALQILSVTLVAQKYLCLFGLSFRNGPASSVEVVMWLTRHVGVVSFRWRPRPLISQSFQTSSFCYHLFPVKINNVLGGMFEKRVMVANYVISWYNRLVSIWNNF